MPGSNIRLVSRLPLRPVFTSLGLPQDAFRAPVDATWGETPFDAGVNCGLRFPGCIWLFRGGECFRYNLRSQAFEDGPTPIANWGGPAWPALFCTGIDTAVWGGPSYPALHWFFKGAQCIRVASDTWTVQPINSLQQEGWGSTQGTALTTGIEVAFHDVRPEANGCVHLVRGGQHVLHNLNNGQKVGEAQPLVEALPGLPEAFQQSFDVAFYGEGREAEILFLLRGSDCCAYDIKASKTVHVKPIDEAFPTMRPYMARPQLFIVESYVLNNYTAEPERGDVVATQVVPPHSSTKVTLVTERTEEANVKTSQSLLQSQDDATSDSFYQSLENQARQEQGSERYRYHMDSQLHGEVQAKGIWGGELDAALAVNGGSDSERQQFATQAMSTLGSQVSRTNRQFAQRAVASEEEAKRLERVVNVQTFEQANPGDVACTIKYYKAIQPYRVALALERMRIGYGDGRTLEIKELVDAERLLEDVLVSAEKRMEVMKVLQQSAGRVTDHEGNHVSLLNDGAASLELKRNLTTEIRFVGDDGTSEQKIVVRGICVHVEEFRVQSQYLLGEDA